MDTLSAAKASRRFYGRSGFKKINAEDLPVKYVFNDDVSGLMKRALCRTAIKHNINGYRKAERNFPFGFNRLCRINEINA